MEVVRQVLRMNGCLKVLPYILRIFTLWFKCNRSRCIDDVCPKKHTQNAAIKCIQIHFCFVLTDKYITPTISSCKFLTIDTLSFFNNSFSTKKMNTFWSGQEYTVYWYKQHLFHYLGKEEFTTFLFHFNFWFLLVVLRRAIMQQINLL